MYKLVPAPPEMFFCLRPCSQYGLLAGRCGAHDRRPIGYTYCLFCFNAVVGDMSPSDRTMASGVVSVVVVGVCNRSQMRTSKCTCLIFGMSIGLDPS